VLTFNNFAEAFQALKAGQSDAATSIDATAMFMQQRGDFTRAISGVFPQTACFAFANKPLAEAVVGALDDLKKDGFYGKLLDQYGVLQIDEPTFSIKGPGPS
jgi:polar amino acid transport system substrate-binding protein